MLLLKFRKEFYTFEGMSKDGLKSGLQELRSEKRLILLMHLLEASRYLFEVLVELVKIDEFRVPLIAFFLIVFLGFFELDPWCFVGWPDGNPFHLLQNNVQNSSIKLRSLCLCESDSMQSICQTHKLAKSVHLFFF